MIARRKSDLYVMQMEAEAATWQRLRMGFGACVGKLHEHPSDEDLQWIREHMKTLEELLECAIGVREACK